MVLILPLIEQACVQLTAQCMRDHPGSAVVQRDGCLIMARVANGGHWDTLKGCDAVLRVTQSVSLCPTSAGVHQAAMGALNAMLRTAPSAKPSVCRAGGVLAATNVLRSNHTRERLQYDTCVLLCLLCFDNPDAKRDAREKAGTSGALVEALRANMHSQRVLLQGLQVMHILTYRSEEGTLSAREAGGVPCVSEIIEEWRGGKASELEMLARNVLGILKGDRYSGLLSITETPHVDPSTKSEDVLATFGALSVTTDGGSGGGGGLAGFPSFGERSDQVMQRSPRDK